MTSYGIRLYDIAANNKIVARGGCSWIHHPVWLLGAAACFDEHDRLYVLQTYREMEVKGGARYPKGPVYNELCTIDWETGTLGEPRPLQWPSQIQEAVKPDWALVYDAAIQADRLFVLYRYAPPLPSDSCLPGWVVATALYRLEDVAPPVLERSDGPLLPGKYIPRCGGYRFVHGANGRVYAQDTQGAFDPLDPKKAAGVRFSRFEHGDYPHWAGPGPVGGQFLFDDGLIAVSGRGGLQLWKVPTDRPSETATPRERPVELGGVRASLWAQAFRADSPILLPAGSGRVWEVHDASAICYDLSDPHRPRKIAHATAPRILDAVSGPEYLLLDHGDGFSLVRHPR